MVQNDKDFIYLASGSPRRAELLDQISVPYQLLSVDVDESLRINESPEDYVSRLALSKAQAGAVKRNDESRPVLGADTTVVINNNILGKPRDVDEAVTTLSMLSNGTHTVFTAIALVDQSFEGQMLQKSLVSMRKIGEKEIEEYWKTGEPKDKAGGYGIQGLAAKFISRLEGSYSGVMGLPLYETSQLLSEYKQFKIEN